MSSTKTARLDHLMHAFARDVRLSFAEWSYAIDFLTRTGQICSDQRQEFILLSDTLGLSMLVDTIDHPASAGVTESTVLGPFYVARAPEVPLGSDVSEGIRSGNDARGFTPRFAAQVQLQLILLPHGLAWKQWKHGRARFAELRRR